MAEVTLELIKTLREKTNAGMMDCKAALTEAGGDLEAAETVLRKKGMAASDKKASRSAKEGVIATSVSSDGQMGVLVEVNCETDFVAKNEIFQGFVKALVDHVASAPSAVSLEEILAQPFGVTGLSVEDAVKTKVGELGEKIVMGRAVRYQVTDSGLVGSYIHLAGKVGVLVEIGCGKAATASSPDLKELARDLTLQITAAHPTCVSRDQVAPSKVATEREIYLDQVKGKPENVAEKIVNGKLDKFFGQVCLLEQGFIKDQDKSIAEVLAAKGKELGDELSVRRFERFSVGETAA
ncbi:MAG: translation elongation factor Ts [Verrucomicrobiales bacterium]|nr:translation elongation factor Ts [Verrucomicrobiales bacterium]